MRKSPSLVISNAVRDPAFSATCEGEVSRGVYPAKSKGLEMTITTRAQDQEGDARKLSLNHLIASSIKLLSKDCLTSNCLALGWSTNFSAFAIALSITLSEGGKAPL